jgi:hypothetical protein
VSEPDSSACRRQGTGMSKKSIIVVVAVAFTGFVVVALLPAFIRARTTPAMNACVNNLRQLDGAKQAWAIENHAIISDIPTWDNLRPYLSRQLVCPQGGKYILGPVGVPPKCSFGGSHTLPQ